MDIPIQDVTQVLFNQLLVQRQMQKAESPETADVPSDFVADQASVIRKAGEIAKEILKTDETENIRIDWTEIDTPENAYQAATSILKYGI